MSVLDEMLQILAQKGSDLIVVRPIRDSASNRMSNGVLADTGGEN